VSDATRRRRERAADQDAGDDAAREAAVAEARRAGLGRHGDKIGRSIVIETVQCHWWGTLIGVTELGGGVGIAHLHPCYWLASTESPTAGEPARLVPSSADSPADVYLSAAVLVATAGGGVWARYPDGSGAP
jgi:hypothetical protein